MFKFHPSVQHLFFSTCISLKLKEELLLATDAILDQLEQSRNKYINEDSLEILEEFEALEDEI